MSYYRRYLPHWHPENASLLLTCRLHGSLPRHSEFISKPSADPKLTEGQRFVFLDRQLDRAPTGPTWLKDSRVAAVVKETLLLACGEWKLFDLFAWVIMSNHVHLLFQPHGKPADIMCVLKSASARGANRILGRTGEPFWQNESYDRWVRNREEFDKITHYIEWNPVSAGSVGKAEDFPWSSASVRLEAAPAMGLRH